MGKYTLSDTALRKKQWVEEFFRDIAANNYFIPRLGAAFSSNVEKGVLEEERFRYGSPNDVMWIKQDLKSQGSTKHRKGDQLTFGLIPRIDPKTNRGMVGGDALAGQAISLVEYSHTSTLQRYLQLVAAGEPLQWHKAAFDLPAHSKAALHTWGIETINLLCCEALATSPSQTFYTQSGTIKRTATYATSKSAITATDKLTPELIWFLNTWVKTGGDRTMIPLRPVMVDGKGYLVLLTYPDCLHDFKQNSTVMQALREAEVRGSENPIFKGAKYIFDGIVIHEHEFVTHGTDGGSGAIPYAMGHLLGASSLVMAMGEDPTIEETYENKGEEMEYKFAMTMKVEKPVFNSQDYGSIGLCLARTNVSNLAAT